jgi:hypothetical protein
MGLLRTLSRSLRGHLPTALARWYPTTAGETWLRDVGDDGTLVTRGGRLRAVLRLRGEPLAPDRSAVATLETLAGAINALPGAVTLLCFGMSGGLAAAVEERRRRVEALALAEGEDSGRVRLARSQAEHLAALTTGEAEGRAASRRYGYYLIVEGATRDDLARKAETVAEAFDAVPVAGREAVEVEAEAWRGVTLPPQHAALWVRDVSHPGGAEMEVDETGATVRYQGREWRP